MLRKITSVRHAAKSSMPFASASLTSATPIRRITGGEASWERTELIADFAPSAASLILSEVHSIGLRIVLSVMARLQDRTRKRADRERPSLVTDVHLRTAIRHN